MEKTKRKISMTKTIGLSCLAIMICASYVALISAQYGVGTPIYMTGGSVQSTTGNFTNLYSTTVTINGQNYTVTISNGTITGHIFVTDTNAQRSTSMSNSLLNDEPNNQSMYITYDPIDAVYDADRNVVWIANHIVPGLSEINASSMGLIANVTFPLYDQPYRLAYDGSNLWISTQQESGSPTFGLPASLIRVNPNNISQWTNYTFANDIMHMNGNGLCIAYSQTSGKEYVFVGLGSNSSAWAEYIERFDPTTFPSAPSECNLRYGSYYGSQVRDIIYPGRAYNVIFVGGDGGRVFSVNIDTFANSSVAVFTGTDVYSGTWDGSYVWWGLHNNTIAKMNPTSYAYALANYTSATSGIVHKLIPTGDGYVWAFSYTNGNLWSINCATMNATAYPTTFSYPHALAYDGRDVWIGDNCTESYSNPFLMHITRFQLQEPNYGSPFVLP
jgi:hypothetical protein